MNRPATVLAFPANVNREEDLCAVAESIDAAIQNFGVMRFCESLTFASECAEQDQPIAA